MIEQWYVDGEYRKISELVYFDSDSTMNQSSIKKWISAMYTEQHYHLMYHFFENKYPTTFHMVMMLYKTKQYKSFIQRLGNQPVKSLSTHLAKMDALFKLKKYEEIANDSLYMNQKRIPLQLKQIKIRANYKLKNHQAIVDLFKTFSSDQLTPEITFIGA